MTQEAISPDEIGFFYANFDAPIAAFDCGEKCAPYNEGGKPFCCDICHAVPTAYTFEWDYLIDNTDLWDEWKAEQCTDSPEEAEAEVERLRKETPSTMVLMECLGPDQCQRDYRALTCRQFPFFPYIDSQGNFLGLSYYEEYEDVCWMINHLEVVTAEYIQQFIHAFEFIFSRIPEEFENYKTHSEVTRDELSEKKRALSLLHWNGFAYKISPHNERMRRVPVDKFPKFGPYKLAEKMPFLDEVS
jgi:hypothetical protein